MFRKKNKGKFANKSYLESFKIRFKKNSDEDPHKEETVIVKNNSGVKNMPKKESKNKECKDKTVKDKTNELKGFHEEKNVLSGKSQQHQAAALKNKFEKEQISKEVAITQEHKEGDNVEISDKHEEHSASAFKKDADIISDGEHKEETVAKEASVADFEKKVDDVEMIDKDMEHIGESVTLRFEDSEKFVNAVSEFDPNLPLDFDENSFIVAVSKEKVDAFRKLMSEKGIEEMPYITEIDKKIAEVQSKRSNRALELDNSKKAAKIGGKDDAEHLEKWLKNPNLSDIVGVDDGER